MELFGLLLLMGIAFLIAWPSARFSAMRGWLIVLIASAPMGVLAGLFLWVFTSAIAGILTLLGIAFAPEASNPSVRNLLDWLPFGLGIAVTLAGSPGAVLGVIMARRGTGAD